MLRNDLCRLRVAGCLIVVIGALGGIDRADAQTPTDRGWIHVNGVYQLNVVTFTDRIEFTSNFEEGYTETDYVVGKTPGIDVMGGVRLWKYVGVGAGITQVSQSGVSTTSSSSVPHPLYFGRSRLITGEAVTDRKDTRLNIFGFVVAPVSDRIRVTVFGGPTMFRGEQELVEVVEVYDQFPFTDPTGDYTEAAHGISAMGFHVGADVSIFFTRSVGVGGVVRYTGGTLQMTSVDGDNISTEAGGLQVGGGLRVIF